MGGFQPWGVYQIGLRATAPKLPGYPRTPSETPTGPASCSLGFPGRALAGPLWAIRAALRGLTGDGEDHPHHHPPTDTLLDRMEGNLEGD